MEDDFEMKLPLGFSVKAIMENVVRVGAKRASASIGLTGGSMGWEFRRW